MSASVNNNNQVNNWCYDTAGNLLAPSACPNQIYTYDGENRLTNTAGYTYIYDGDGQRVKKVAGSTGTIYYRVKSALPSASGLPMTRHRWEGCCAVLTCPHTAMI